MSSSGWGAPGNGPPDGQWQAGGQQGGDQQGGPAPQGPGHGPQGPGYAPPSAPGGGMHAAPAYGSPQGPGSPQGGGWGPNDPQSPGGPGGPGGPRGPGGPGGYGGFGPQQPKKRPWVLIGVAMTCVLALLLVVGGGVAFLALRSGAEPVASDTPSQSPSPEEDPESPSEDPSTTPTESEESDFELAVPYDPPTGTADELWSVMTDNPLTSGTLPALPECVLPATPVAPSVEELQAVLDASGSCLNQIWATASSDRDLPWVSPKIVVYTHPDIPAEAVCDSNFSADFPRMCNLDSTIYWPVGYGGGYELDDPADVPGAFLWDLSYIYTNTLSWNSTLTVWYQTLRDELEGTDEKRFNEAWQRFAMQRECIASAASMQVPTAAEPTAALREKLTDPATWLPGEPPESVTPENRAMWIERGFDSGGDLSVCNAWTADASEVA